jgi:beta-glucosidase
VVDAGVAAVMSAYNSVNGQWCGQNRTLLTEVLRDEWGFTGFVISDFVWGLRDPVGSLAAGLDVEMPFAQQRAGTLPAALSGGAASWTDVDRAALRILATQLRFSAAVTAPPPDPAAVVASPEHRALAREVAARGAVLLRNEPVHGRPVLPLDAAALRRVAVLGTLADVPNTGDHGSSDVRAPEVVTPLAGLRAALPEVDIVHHGGADRGAAAELARGADAAVVVVGYTATDEGEYVGPFDPALAVLYPPSGDPAALDDLARVWESGPQAMGGDRTSLRLHPDQEALVREVARANARTVVVVLAGSAVVMEAWRREVPAILLLWYPGMEGGHALADVLLGRTEPGGRLPFAVPTDEAHLAPFDRDATVAHYDRWHGQRLLDRTGNPAAFPLGFGLSYTSFRLTDPTVDIAGGGIGATVTVHNTGTRAGGHVVQMYGSRAAPDGLERVLLGFARVELGAGESRRVRVGGDARLLSRRTGPGRWEPLPGPHRIEVGSYAGDPDALTEPVHLPVRPG